MSDFLSSPLGKLDGDERLVSPVFKGPTAKGFGFRGEIALKLAPSIAGEKRPPDIKTDQVFMLSDSDKITFFASFVDSLAHLELISEVRGRLTSRRKASISSSPATWTCSRNTPSY